MFSFRRFLFAAVAGVAAAAFASASVPAAASDSPKPATGMVEATADPAADPAGPVPGGFASWPELMAMQEVLNKAADRIQAAAGSDSGSGYAGIVAAPEERALRLYWKGELPDAVQRVVGELAPAVPVRLQAASHSMQELLPQARQVVERGRDSGVTAAAPLPDGSGIRVSVTGPADPDVAGQLSGVRDATVPVRLAPGAPAPAYDRFHDSSPYWGGSGWKTAAGNGCSTGFAIRNYATGLQSLLTAGHCAGNGDTAYTMQDDGFFAPIGQFGGKNKSTDTAAVTVFTAAAGRIYWGGTNSSDSKAVVAASSNWVGNWICTSGAYSGSRCGGKVVSTNETITIDGSLVFPLVRAERSDHTNLAGGGDSGGPVAQLSSSNPNGVHAKGTIVANDLNAPATCTGVPGSSTRKCSWAVYYIDIYSAMWPYGAGLVYWK